MSTPEKKRTLGVSCAEEGEVVTGNNRPPFMRGGLCEIWPHTCPNRATLMVYTEACECSPCNYWCEDGDDCLGHPVCDEHGAILRIKKLPQRPRSADSPPFVVTRIHTLEVAS